MKKMRLLPSAVLAANLLLAAVLCSAGCTFDKQKDGDKVIENKTSFYGVMSTDYYVSGMRYKVFSSGKGFLFVVNITKDSLDVAKNSR